MANPWLTIWTAPRRTFRRLMEKERGKDVLYLVLLNGCIAGINGAILLFAKDIALREQKLPTILFAVIFFIGLAVLHYYLGSLMYTWTGSWIKGRGSFYIVKRAVGWANYPFGVSNLIMLLSHATLKYPHVALAIALLNLAVLIWASFIFLFLLAEAHEFSLARSFVTVFVTSALLFIVIMVIIFVIPLIEPLVRI